MRRWLYGVLILTGFGLASCYRYVPLGTTPPENPDYSPPIKARITLARPLKLPAGPLRDPGDSVSGKIKKWGEDSILLHVDNCSVDPKCTVEIPLSAVSNVEARTPSFSSGAQSELTGEAVIVLLASGAALVLFGWLVYEQITYNPFEDWGRN